MKKMKKIFALLLSFVMIMGMAVTANAATIVKTDQDTSVMTMSSTNGTVSYKATTVQGDGTTANPTVTRYAYYIMLPENGSLDKVNVTVKLGDDYETLKADGETLTTNGSCSKELDFTSGTKTFIVYDDDNKEVREFQVTAGIKGANLETVYVRVDVKNAVDWATNNKGTTKADTVNKKIDAIKDTVSKKYPIDSRGIMTVYVPVNLKSGATAMDALKAACGELGLSIQGSSTYVEAIGTSTLKLGQFDTDGMSGWMYLAKTSAASNFEAANYGAASYNLTGGEYFAWVFVNTWGGGQTDYLNKSN